MTETTETAVPEKRKIGRPRKFGPRRVFHFRISETTRERIIASAAGSGRSASEEIEYRLTESLAHEMDQQALAAARAEATALVSAAKVTAIRLAGLSVLREVAGTPARVVVDLATLLGEADGLLRGYRSGFYSGEAPPPVARRTLTPDEGELLGRELERVRRMLDAAVARGAASADDAAA